MLSDVLDHMFSGPAGPDHRLAGFTAKVHSQ